MPKKKSKGRGRGRGRGRGQEDLLQVGTSSDTNTPSNELKRPGNNSSGKKNEEQKSSKEQTQQTEQNGVQPHSNYDERQAASKALSQKDPNQVPYQKQTDSTDPPNKPTNPSALSGQAAPTAGAMSKEMTLPHGPPSSTGSTKPQPQPQGPRPNGNQGVQVVASAMSEERPLHLKQQKEPLPRRPGYGNKGRPIRLKANFFKLDFSDMEYIYHYDIDIKPEKTPISECREIVNCAVNKYEKYFDHYHPAYDGKKNLYCRKKLSGVNGTGCELEIKLPGKDGDKDRTFKLTIKYAAQVRIADLNEFLNGQNRMPQEAVQALDIVLRQIPSLHFTPVGRSFFPTNIRGTDLGGGCEVRTGFYQSIRPSEWKTMLVNIDVSSKGFVKAQPVISLLCEIAQVNEAEIANNRWKLDRWKEREFLETIKGFRVETGHLGRKRKYLVVDLGKKSAEAHTFILNDDGGGPQREISVKNYFQEKYRINLRYPHLPCLVVGQKKNYLPMEVCEVVPSQKRKLTDAQTAEMIKKVTKPAGKRKADIEDWAGQLEASSRPYLNQEYGMSISSKMVDVNGRVLPPPKVTLGNEASITPRDGVWDMRDKKFFHGCVINSWAMVCFLDQRRCGQNVTGKFAQQMESVCRREGMQMSGRPCIVKYSRMNENIEQLFTEMLLKFEDLQLILVALPARDNKEVYKEVKRVGDTVLGIPTQCVQAKQFEAAKPQVCSNIAMKINAKLGGTNHVIDPLEVLPLFENVIVFGADVTHPSPGESNIPSIAAVVASMDCYASRYAARVRAQTHLKDKSAQEIILDMAAMVRELLIEFFKATNKTKPKRIIFYRDGVSEGQFDQVLLHEVRAVQQACLSLDNGEYKPPITFIVVQKRHHARLFCTDKKDESGRAGNVPPGTMVDSGITHPFEFDFYLCSHQGIQGTSRPTHYHVLYDDNNFDANSLHKLTYHLCHTYARCTRSVSMPSPAYYAHLVAFRARHHLNGIAFSRNGRQDKDEKKLLEEFSKAINVNQKMKGGMYFA